ncbi:MAG: sugar phosphate isomerase/epimerase family protein [Fimbriimonadaceae bacterium]
MFHASIEGAQHGGKSLDEFLKFAKDSGAAGAQPSNFIVQSGEGFHSAKEVRDLSEKHGIKIDGISAHCVYWVHTTAWTGSPTIRPFVPGHLHNESPEKIEAWCEDYLIRLMDLSAELNLKTIPMFWGIAFGWEVATGYPWGLFSGPGYDLIEEGKERFVNKTAKLRKEANDRGLYICHEIHPNTAALCADDFNMLVDITDGDKSMAVIADPSHCWENESPETRFQKVRDRVMAAHVKNFVVRPGISSRKMDGDWPNRAHQFVDLPTGDLNMVRYVELLMNIGYPERYKALHGTETAPLVVEAESAYRDLDATSVNGIQYVRDELIFPVAEMSFEEGMGAK